MSHALIFCAQAQGVKYELAACLARNRLKRGDKGVYDPLAIRTKYEAPAALALALAHIVSERAMSFGVKARAAAQTGATAAVAYLAARVAEEQLDFGRIDCVLGLRDVMDGEEMFWRTQHADGQPVPSVSTVLRDNAASSQKRTADALTKSVTEHREFSVSAHDSHVQGGGVGAHVVGCAPRGAVLSFCAPSNSNCC